MWHAARSLHAAAHALLIAHRVSCRPKKSCMDSGVHEWLKADVSVLVNVFGLMLQAFLMLGRLRSEHVSCTACMYQTLMITLINIGPAPSSLFVKKYK